jgi:pimeloyl-ACP methyl ester carboxylesterase
MSSANYKSLLDFREACASHSLNINGIEWEYISCGAGDETVLFLHGLAGAKDIWWLQMAAWESEYRSIAVTYPPVRDLAGLAEGIITILDQEGVGKVNLVGSSLGGYLVQYLVKAYPERVKRAVLSNTYAHPEPLAAKYRLVGSLLPVVPEWLVMTVMRWSFRTLIYPASGRSILTLNYLLEQASGGMSKAQVLNRYYNVIERFPLPRPEQSNIPVLIVESDNDPLIEPPWRESLRAAYPSATVVTLHGVGHFPYLNMPDSYREILEAFFKDRDQSAPPAMTSKQPR